jgi:hypothetical protein
MHVKQAPIFSGANARGPYITRPTCMGSSAYAVRVLVGGFPLITDIAKT